MKLYIVSSQIDVSVDGTKFKQFNKVCVSQAECASTRKELTNRGVGRKDIDTYEVDVPTAKTELVGFLNQLMSGDYIQDGVRQVAATYKPLK